MYIYVYPNCTVGVITRVCVFEYEHNFINVAMFMGIPHLQNLPLGWIIDANRLTIASSFMLWCPSIKHLWSKIVRGSSFVIIWSWSRWFWLVGSGGEEGIGRKGWCWLERLLNRSAVGADCTVCMCSVAALRECTGRRIDSAERCVC
jgi:hypothetical protein